jgi:hypothetical protein
MPSFIQPPSEELPLGLPGQVSRLGAFITTRTLNQAAGVDVGLLVAPSGTAGQECISPTTAAGVQTAVGFTCLQAMSTTFDATHQYADNEAVAILESGHMYVLSEGSCVADEPVYVRITSDGGSNTVLGKVRGDNGFAAGGIVLTPAATYGASAHEIGITISDGVVEKTFNLVTDASPTTAEVAAGLVALIDADPDFGATGTVTISITSTRGPVELVDRHSSLALTTGGLAVLVPGTFFDASRTGAGLVEIRRNKIN